jgi:hypothetical protein
MKADLPAYCKQGKSKEYFDNVFQGYYETQYFDTKFNLENGVSKLKQLREIMKSGIKRFEKTEFNDFWTGEIDQFSQNLKSRCDDFIIKMELSFHSPKSPKVISDDFKTVPALITQLAHLPNLPTCNFSVSKNDVYVMVSEDRHARLVSPKDNYRVLKDFECTGPEKINNFTCLSFNRPQKSPLFFILIGGHDDFPSLEVWDPITAK